MADERIQVAVPIGANDNLKKMAEKMDTTKGKVVEKAISELAKKVLK